MHSYDHPQRGRIEQTQHKQLKKEIDGEIYTALTMLSYLTNGLVSRVEQFSERLGAVLTLNLSSSIRILGQLTQNTSSNTSDVLSWRVEQLHIS